MSFSELRFKLSSTLGTTAISDGLWIVSKLNCLHNFLLLGTIILAMLSKNLLAPFHSGLAEIIAPVGSQEVVGHTLDSQLFIAVMPGYMYLSI